MYLFKVIEKMLAHEEENKLNDANKSKKNSRKSSSKDAGSNSYSQNSKGLRNSGNYTKDNKDNFKKKGYTKDNSMGKSHMDKKLMAYCLFSDSGESFLAMHNDDKKRIFLHNINHKDKFTPESKTANQFINEHIKKKTVYLDIVEELDNGDIVAEVFTDREKTYSLNQMLIDEGLNFSEAKKYQKKEVSDMKVVNDNTSKKENQESQVNSNTQKNNNLDNNKIIGYVKKFGKDNYLHKSDNSLSYYITIEHDDKEITKWGVDLERAIQSSKIKINDYIELSKEKQLDNNQKKQVWAIKLLADINQRYQENDGPPIEESLESIPPEVEEGDYGYQEPYEWEHEDSSEHYEDSNHLSQTEQQYFSSNEEPSTLKHESIQNKEEIVVQESISSIKDISNITNSSEEHDPMDDILSALDKPMETKKFNMKTN